MPFPELNDADDSNERCDTEQHAKVRENVNQSYAAPENLEETIHGPVHYRDLADRLHEFRHERRGKPGSSDRTHCQDQKRTQSSRLCRSLADRSEQHSKGRTGRRGRDHKENQVNNIREDIDLE